MTKVRFVLLLLVIAAIYFLLAGRLLLVDKPEHADAILVLAGETQFRPQKGLQFLRQGYAPRLILDVSNQERIFTFSLPELAQRWEQSFPENQQMSVCPIMGLSTRDEAREAANCLKRFNAHNVLIVTSDFHTRRASSIFQHELPNFHFSIAGAYNPVTFGMAWWKHREWAKTTLYESMRLWWWELVDRWR
jgi:uncharacterized SAM-binding protein YcdF (DUF218 family)